MVTFYLLQRTGFAWRPGLFFHRYVYNYDASNEELIKWLLL